MTTKPKEIKIVGDSDNGKRVKEYMTENPEVISPQSTIREAANIMESVNTGSLPVGNKRKLLGFITDRDIVNRAVAEGLDPEVATVEDIMTEKVLYCYEDSELKAVADNMKENKVLRLVVLDKNKMFRGVITHSQLARAAIETDDHELCKKVAELGCCYGKCN